LGNHEKEVPKREIQYRSQHPWVSDRRESGEQFQKFRYFSPKVGNLVEKNGSKTNEKETKKPDESHQARTRRLKKRKRGGIFSQKKW